MDTHIVFLCLMICALPDLGKTILLGGATVKTTLPAKCTLHQNGTCPPGSCCVRDDFLFTETYCKALGKEMSSCTTRRTEYECPCKPEFECRPNIQSQGHVSLFGKCHRVAGTITTEASTPLGTGGVDSVSPLVSTAATRSTGNITTTMAMQSSIKPSATSPPNDANSTSGGSSNVVSQTPNVTDKARIIG